MEQPSDYVLENVEQAAWIDGYRAGRAACKACRYVAMMIAAFAVVGVIGIVWGG